MGCNFACICINYFELDRYVSSVAPGISLNESQEFELFLLSMHGISQAANVYYAECVLFNVQYHTEISLYIPFINRVQGLNANKKLVT